jgi:dihydropteroate synthase
MLSMQNSSSLFCALAVAVSALAAQQGAWAVRVHEVRATADAVRVARAIEGARER